MFNMRHNAMDSNLFQESIFAPEEAPLDIYEKLFVKL